MPLNSKSRKRTAPDSCQGDCSCKKRCPFLGLLPERLRSRLSSDGKARSPTLRKASSAPQEGTSCDALTGHRGPCATSTVNAIRADSREPTLHSSSNAWTSSMCSGSVNSPPTVQTFDKVTMGMGAHVCDEETLISRLVGEAPANSSEQRRDSISRWKFNVERGRHTSKLFIDCRRQTDPEAYARESRRSSPFRLQGQPIHVH